MADPVPSDVPQFVQPTSADGEGRFAGPLELQAAPLRRRVLAELVDGSIVAALALLALAPIWLARGSVTGDSGLLGLPTESTTSGAMLITALENTIVLAIWVIYSAKFTGRVGGWNGQTPGRRAADIRIAAADGHPLTVRAAWLRTLVISTLASGPMIVGALIDALAGTTPTAYEIGPFAGIGLMFVALLPALVGGQRRALHDRAAGTVVLRSKPADLPLGATTPTAAGGGPLPARVLPLRIGGSTIALTATAVLLAVGGALGALAIDAIQPSKAEFQAVIAESENAGALSDIREVEGIVRTCLTTGGKPDDCQWPQLPDDSSVELVEQFDISADPPGSHAGKVGTGADESGKHVYIYGFTSSERIWFSEVARDGERYHSCLTRDEDICDGVGFHEW